jgi:hypothetical protein
MTIPEIRALEGEALRIAVAEAEGWTQLCPSINGGLCGLHNGFMRDVESFEEDRDAITEAILRRFTDGYSQHRFNHYLGVIIGDENWTHFRAITATATELSRAFLATIERINPTENTK